MINTNIGSIKILINDQALDYKPTILPNEGKQFIVDGRYQVEIINISVNTDTVIDCILENRTSLPISSFSESGERLALISFIVNNMKLSIGLEGDIPGVFYEYLNDRLRVRITKNALIMKLVIYIAWLTMDNTEIEEIYTWFAADPTLA